MTRTLGEQEECLRALKVVAHDIEDIYIPTFNEHYEFTVILEAIDRAVATLKEIRKEVLEIQARLPEPCGWLEEVGHG